MAVVNMTTGKLSLMYDYNRSRKKLIVTLTTKKDKQEAKKFVFELKEMLDNAGSK